MSWIINLSRREFCKSGALLGGGLVLGIHLPAGLAVTALRHVFLDPGELHRMSLSQPFDGRDFSPFRLLGRYLAGGHGLAVDLHGAGAALADAAAEFRAGKPYMFPNGPQQRDILLNFHLVIFVIDVE